MSNRHSGTLRPGRHKTCLEICEDGNTLANDSRTELERGAVSIERGKQYPSRSGAFRQDDDVYGMLPCQVGY